jgi:phenylacetic acid degradation operon negative regulatory protein
VADELGDLLDPLRPLSARSIVATALIGVRPPRLPVAVLVQAASLFGVAPGALRTALWRMVEKGEVTSEEGWYTLSGPLLDRRRQLDESHDALRRPWDGTWELAVVAGEGRPARERAELRAAADALHLAELREGVWMRPDNLDRDRLPSRRSVLDRQCTRLFGATAEADLVGGLFRPDAWAATARRLVDGIDRTIDHEGDQPSDLARDFLVSIAVARHLNADPLLPVELLPATWPGGELRASYDRFDAWYKQRLTAALRAPAR